MFSALHDEKPLSTPLQFVCLLAQATLLRLLAPKIKEEILKVLSTYQSFKVLDNLSLAFTIFNREAGVAYSGHIGPSRPLVLGSENKVRPENSTLFNFRRWFRCHC